MVYRANNTMTSEEIQNNEFSNEFDVLYNNITSNQAPGLDEYEKSVFLTKAQDEIVKAYFNPKTNKVQEGFDGNEKRQIDFSMITCSYSSTTFSQSFFDNRPNTKSIDVPDDILMYVNEYATVQRDNTETRLTIIPISYTEYTRLMSKPYKRPLKNQAWRLLDHTNGSRRAEIIVGPNDTIQEYVVRYIKKPRAIRLVTFDDGVTLGGDNVMQSCELDPILFPEIIQRACELAKASYSGDLSSQIALGQTSHTELGIVTQGK